MIRGGIQNIVLCILHTRGRRSANRWQRLPAGADALVMFSVMKHTLPYGMMITVSHNPAIYNGIKAFTEGGRDADEEQTTADTLRSLQNYVLDRKCNLGIATDGDADRRNRRSWKFSAS